MYSTNLAKISLDEFEKILFNAQLLPTQKVILNNLSQNVEKLKYVGITDLQQLQSYLKNKKNYPSIRKDIGIDVDCLVRINRMVNSYVVKVVPLEKLDIFSNDELSMLEGEMMKNTKQYYDAFTSIDQKDGIADKTGISVEKLDYALGIVDLLRINGVGADYAKILYKIGIKCINDYKKTPSEVILNAFKALNVNKDLTKATLGISDIDYCRRFCDKLDCDIV